MTHVVGGHLLLLGLSLLLLGVGAQGPELGFCGTYKTSENFTEDFILKVENSEASYSFLLSTGQTGGCRKLKLYSTNIFYYQTTDLSGNPSNVSSTFETQPYSASKSATLSLSGLPFAELGALLGSVTFYVVRARGDLLALLSCYNIGLIRFRQLHVLVPDILSRTVSPLDVRAELMAAAVPLSDRLKELPQTCPRSF